MLLYKFLIYFIAVNIFSFLVMYIDKIKAKKGFVRIPEKHILLIAFLGGSIGTILGMYVFRHKTKKMKFKIGVPLIIVLQVILLIYYLM